MVVSAYKVVVKSLRKTIEQMKSTSFYDSLQMLYLKVRRQMPIQNLVF
jgi:hypothetical protein